MQFYKILSVLLDYPDDGLRDNLEDIAEVVNSLDSISDDERNVVTQFIQWIQGQDSIELQGLYVQIFDFNQDNSLHLTHHLLGDDRERGPALVDLGEFYNETGWKAHEKELPDYLPLILEFVSTQDEMAARIFLSDAAKAINMLADNLEKSESEYVPLINIIAKRAQRVPVPTHVQKRAQTQAKEVGV